MALSGGAPSNFRFSGGEESRGGDEWSKGGEEEEEEEECAPAAAANGLVFLITAEVPSSLPTAPTPLRNISPPLQIAATSIPPLLRGENAACGPLQLSNKLLLLKRLRPINKGNVICPHPLVY